MPFSVPLIVDAADIALILSSQLSPSALSPEYSIIPQCLHVLALRKSLMSTRGVHDIRVAREPELSSAYGPSSDGPTFSDLGPGLGFGLQCFFLSSGTRQVQSSNQAQDVDVVPELFSPA